MIREIVNYIEDQIPAYALGDILFSGFRGPNSPDRCITILERTGATHDFYIPGKTEVPIQIMTRSTSYEEARDDNHAVVGLFHGFDKAGITLPTITSGVIYFIGAAELISGPAWLGQDERGRHEFTANILMQVQLN